MKRLVVWFLMVMLVVPAFLAVGGGQGEAKGKGFVVALSNSFYGNTWRKQMVDTMQVAAKEAKAQGLISDFIVANGDGTEQTQLQQLNSLILQDVDLILINAASPTGLNGVLEKAHQQGIKIIAFDSIVTSPYAYKIEYDFGSWGSLSAQYIVDRFKGQARVLVTRGVIGSLPETQCNDAMNAVFKKATGIQILGEVVTQADIATSQSAVANVLASLSDIDACVGMSGDFGVVQAFEAAGRPVPVIVGSNRAEFILWWIQEKAKSGYETISLGSEPSIGAVAFWVGMHILKGDKVPEMITTPYQLPLVPVTNKTVDSFKDIQPGTVLAQTFTDKWVVDNILNK